MLTLAYMNICIFGTDSFKGKWLSLLIHHLDIHMLISEPDDSFPDTCFMVATSPSRQM
jgi:hypothetical protein